MKNIMLFGLVVITSFILIACDHNNTAKLGLAEDAQIVIDGFIDEESYDIIPSRKAGVVGAVDVKYAADKQGLYVGLTVTDDNHQVARTGLVNSDYVGIVIDAHATGGANNLIETYTHLLRVDVEKNYVYSVGDGYGGWVDITSGQGTNLNITDGPEVHIEVVLNHSYIVEMFFSWALLDTTAEEIEASNQVMYYIEHRNLGVDVKADANIASPSNYNRLTLLGDRKGSNMPQAVPTITMDGILDDSKWDSATITNVGNFKDIFDESIDAGDFVAKAFMDDTGLYIGVQVEDADLYAPYGPGEAYKNDGMELRIHVFNADDLPLLSYKWLLDLHGFQWNETGAGGINSSFAPLAQVVYSFDGTVNDQSDIDTGWSVEIFIPLEHLGITSATDYIKLLNSVGTYEQNNALNSEYAQKNPDSWDVVEDYPEIRR